MEFVSVILAVLIGLPSVVYLFGVIIFFGLSYLETRASWDYHPKVAILEAGALFFVTLLVFLILAMPLSVYVLPIDIKIFLFFLFSAATTLLLIVLLIIYYYKIPQKGYRKWQLNLWYVVAVVVLFWLTTLLAYETRYIVLHRSTNPLDLTSIVYLGVFAIVNLLLASPIWAVIFDGWFLEYDPITLWFADGSVVSSRLIQDTSEEYICWDEDKEQVLYFPKNGISRAVVE